MWDIESTMGVIKEASRIADPHALIPSLAAHVRRTMHVERSLLLALKDPCLQNYEILQAQDWSDPTGGFTDVTHRGCSRIGGLLARIASEAKLVLISNLRALKDDSAYDLLTGYKSLLAFPVYEAGAAVRVIVMLSALPSICDEPQACELALMGNLLDRVIQTHELARELQSTCAALDNELRAASEVQRWLLPWDLPRLKGIDIGAFYRSARRAGGDYYDILRLPDGRLGLIIADVCGKGAPAAVLMAVIRTIAHLDSWRHQSPASLLAFINGCLCDLGLDERGLFVTAFCGILDLRDRSLTYSSAGHHPPRLRSWAKGDAVRGLDGARCFPLGVSRSTLYRDNGLVLEPHDLILLYTDGIVEAPSTSGQWLGIEGLDGLLRCIAVETPSRAVVRAVLGTLTDASGSSLPSDDQTLVALTLTGDDL
jgi:phosphoserine phosphatase RsbU/P